MAFRNAGVDVPPSRPHRVVGFAAAKDDPGLKVMAAEGVFGPVMAADDHDPFIAGKKLAIS